MGDRTSEPEEVDLHELDLDEVLTLAMGLHQGGRLDEADGLYRAILEALPRQPDALHFLGVLSHQRGRGAEAAEWIARAVAAAPDYADAHNNLGNVLKEQGRLEEAAASYRRVIELRPDHADAYNNLGVVRKAQGRLEEAASCYQRAIELRPTHADAYQNLGNLLKRQGKLAEAVAHYRMAIAVNPEHPEAKKLLGMALYAAGHPEEARDVFREWLEQDPQNPVAAHLYAAHGGASAAGAGGAGAAAAHGGASAASPGGAGAAAAHGGASSAPSPSTIPLRASNGYVRTVFDGMAASFDDHLAELDYRAPELVLEAWRRECPAAGDRLDVLDAGCGTGLCGPSLRPHARRLVGVDLSPGMLARARAREVYDELVEAELTHYLEAHPDAWDLIVAADTLCYFGVLEALLSAAATALREGGVLVFTVEAAQPQEAPGGYRLNPHGRYSHDEAYVVQALSEVGLRVDSVTRSTLRKEGGEPVAGLVVAARRTHSG